MDMEKELIEIDAQISSLTACRIVVYTTKTICTKKPVTYFKGEQDLDECRYGKEVQYSLISKLFKYEGITDIEFKNAYQMTIGIGKLFRITDELISYIAEALKIIMSQYYEGCYFEVNKLI